MGLFDKFRKEKIKTFEDDFMDVQEDMIALCEELAGDNAVDEIFVYGSIEMGAVSFNAFYLMGGSVVTASKISCDLALIKEFLRQGADDLLRLTEVCNVYNKPVPTEIRLRYTTEDKHLDVHYEYEPICTPETDTLPNEVFQEWRESVEKGYSDLAR